MYKYRKRGKQQNGKKALQEKLRRSFLAFKSFAFIIIIQTSVAL